MKAQYNAVDPIMSDPNPPVVVGVRAMMGRDRAQPHALTDRVRPAARGVQLHRPERQSALRCRQPRAWRHRVGSRPSNKPVHAD